MNTDDINSIYYGSFEITDYTVHTDYISFPSSYENKSLEISYNKDVIKLIIPPIDSDVLTKLDIISCNGVSTYNIATSSKPNDELCKIPSRFDVDVADGLNLTIDEVKGKVISCDKLGSFIVDNRGKITVTINSQDEFSLDCSSIVDKAEIYIDSTGVEYA